MLNQLNLSTETAEQIIEKIEDERLKYLIKFGEVMRCDDKYQIVLAKLPQIPDVWIYYRSRDVREKNPHSLDFCDYQLGHIPLIEGEEDLRKIDLSNNDILEIENLVSLHSLTELNISHNRIRKLGACFDQVPTIRVLDLCFNFLEELEGMSSLTFLEDLNLSHNKIKDISGLRESSELM